MTRATRAGLNEQIQRLVSEVREQSDEIRRLTNVDAAKDAKILELEKLVDDALSFSMIWRNTSRTDEAMARCEEFVRQVIERKASGRMPI